LRWTIGILVSLSLVVGGGWMLHELKNRPAGYHPGEASVDITSSLARGLPPGAPSPQLTDVTAAAGLSGFRNFVGPRASELPEDMGPGLAWGDYDQDGDDDLFLVGAGGGMDLPEESLVPCALFENLGDGTFRLVSGFPETRIRGLGAAWGDYDGDGFLDLAVAGYNALHLFRNDAGSGRFTPDDRLPNRPGFWSAVSWGDFDGDRRLDLYVANYVQYAEDDNSHAEFSDQLGTAVPYTLNPASYTPGLNALYQQRPDGSFRDVAKELGVENPKGRSLGALWHDFDQDGHLDLYVANDVSDNVFYRNTGEGFEDVSHAAWVADYRSAMGLAVGDFDRDGDDDLFVTHWVAQENALYENLWADFNSTAQQNTEVTDRQPDLRPIRFVDIADQKGLGQVALRQVGWGAEFADFDHDGWLDLVVANGSTLEVEGPAPKRLRPQESFFFWSREGKFFHNLASQHADLQEKHVSRGLACADFDNDGDLDLAIADHGEGVRLFRNDMAQGHWLKVHLRSRNAEGLASGSGYGSTVIAWVDGTPLRRSVTSVSYLSQSSTVLHWGLGAAERVDRLEVRWHAGDTNIYEDLPADTLYEWSEGETAPRRIDSDRSEGGLLPVPPDSPSSGKRSDPKTAQDERQRLIAFWRIQRAAMDALKIDRDHVRAARLLREALELNPSHEDSRYYLALSLTYLGKTEAAMRQLRRLQELNPQSQRAWQEWAVLRAKTATTTAELEAAAAAASQAHRINPEETGALLLLGEVALMQGNFTRAREHLSHATRTNPKAAGGFFLLAYMAAEAGNHNEARQLLHQTREALGPDWQPEGATSEGDVLVKQHRENTPLAEAWTAWSGEADPETVFTGLRDRLNRANP
jgi:tetratricopeptide (TPR) repeat protein